MEGKILYSQGWGSELQRLILLAVFVFFTSFAVGKDTEAEEDHPTTGIVYGETEKQSLKYTCKKLNQNKIECNFIGTNILQSKKENDWENRKKNALSTFRKKKPAELTKLKNQSCQLSSMMKNYLAGKISPPKAPKLEKVSTLQKNYFRKLADTMQKFCRKPNEKTYIESERFSFETELKTCGVSSNSFTQQFSRQGQSSRNVWVVEDKPTGPCGVVQLDRFQLENKKLGFWNYYSRKAVTNPSGIAIIIPCSKLDQNEYKFSWKSREIHLNCQIMKFSPF